MVYRTTTIAPFISLRREMDRLFEDAFGRGEASAAGAAAVATWIPATDVREDEFGYTFELELPGLAPEQVEVTTESGVLTVRGEKRAPAPAEGQPVRTHVAERVQGAFRRAFPLPKDVAEERIEATFANGLLTLRLPKVERPKARKIEVK